MKKKLSAKQWFALSQMVSGPLKHTSQGNWTVTGNTTYQSRTVAALRRLGLIGEAPIGSNTYHITEAGRGALNA